MSTPRPLRVCVAGSWDPDVGRNRILLRLLTLAGCEVTTVRVELWGTREDAVVRRGKLRTLLRALIAVPTLMLRCLRAPRADVVIVPYPGHLDVPVVKAIARLRGMPLLFDPFISLFDTIVSDRALSAPDSLLGRAARMADWVSLRCADLVLADTAAHAEYFAELADIAGERIRVLEVGAQQQVFKPQPGVAPDPGLVLFYGTYIPLHGIETIVRAAKALEPDGLRVRIIGTGQERARIDALVATLAPRNIEMVDAVSLEELPREIARAGICLGVFGSSGKTDRVVPNKVYECLAIGRPVISGATTAMRAAFTAQEVEMVPVGDADALAVAIRALRSDPDRRERMAAAGHARFQRDYAERALSTRLLAVLEEMVEAHPRP